MFILNMNNLDKINLFKKKDTHASILCYLAKSFKVILSLIFLLIFIILLPVLPFIWISYKGFHGRYGIVKLIREVTKL